MNTRQFGILVMTTLFAGVMGGALSNLVFVNTGVLAEETEQTKKVVTAEEFRLVTKDGQPRATLLLWNGELPALTLANETCHNRVFLGVFNEAQPALILNDKGCKQRAALDLQPDGLPSLTLRDKHDVPRARLRVLLDGSPVLTLFDQNGQVAWSPSLSSSER
ncbi:hypothetical protein [Candidatus Nitrospira neomarina]|uniref:Uncharacterized protein n=1 Tax=Candidatus Nitrospira neomarina TaxID=3020899 RepID=A0AA96JWN6_9BACT|nr:hypothetical protein [Candidatus Nitrospira neomarina]WNM62235.1 hypothetical protein PQG83_00385 [Candidatus Nitrospira neomarina]